MPRRAHEESEIPRLIAIHPGIRPQRIELTKDAYAIGRADVCDIVVARRTVSRVHARIRREDLRYLLEDARSRNGTYLNGRRIDGPTVLNPGDQIGFGSPRAELEHEDPEGTEESVFQLRFDAPRQRFFFGKVSLELTPNQYRLLYYLYEHPDVLCTRQCCGNAIWHEYNPQLDGDNLDRTISDLRARLTEAGADPNLLKTCRGQGYVLGLETFGENQQKDR